MSRLLASVHLRSNCRAVVGLSLLLASSTSSAVAQTQQSPPESHGATIGKFLAGAAIGLAAHESGHLVFDFIFDADPGVRKVDFHGIPFFAVTHRSGLPRRQEFLISSAGFWVQHAENEWLLARGSGLRRERAPMAKGAFAFNVLTSVAYSGAAFAKTGPVERDTRGIADSSRVDERVIGALLLAPALLDAWRYFHPDAKWAVWSSRGVKLGMVVLIAR